MVSKGWCPSVVAQLSTPCATFLYYCSLLGPPRVGDDHSGCSNEETCVAGNISNEARSTQKHVTEGCKCEQVAVDTKDGSKVSQAIGRGEIPVLRIKEDGDSLEIEVHTSESPIAYIALSHV